MTASVGENLGTFSRLLPGHVSAYCLAMHTEAKTTSREIVLGASSRTVGGKLIEPVLDLQVGRTQLVVGDKASTTIEDTAQDSRGSHLKPISASNNLIRHQALILPGAPLPFGDRDSLIRDIEDYVARYVDLSPRFLRIASAYVLLSWLYDAFNELPYLRFRGDFGSGKTRALKVLGSIMYKPLFTSGASTTSPIFHALDLFRGTLVLDESDFRASDERAELTKILNQGNVRGFPVLRSQATAHKTFDPRAFHVYGPKLVAMRNGFDDQALESRFLTEEMGQRPLRANIALNLPKQCDEEASALRCRLLAYRFATLDETKIQPECHDASLSPRTNQVMAPLLSVLPGRDLRGQVLEAMKAAEEAVAAERAASIEGQLLEVLLMINVGAHTTSVGKIADAYRARFGSESDRPLSARYIGNVLRNKLHLVPVRRHGLFVLPEGCAARIEALAARFGVLPYPDSRPSQVPIVDHAIDEIGMTE